MKADGYVTEVTYPVRYHRELNPSLQRMALLTNNIAAPDPEKLTYLELGCGQGFSLLMLAVARPAAHFIGIDINPANLSRTQAMAQAAGVTNLRLLARSFADLAADEIPPCDVIALHGVWSWINADNRAHLLRLVAARLKPGGVLYISYNSLPGTASLTPLRELMVDAAARATGPLTERIDAGIAFAEKLRRCGAQFFSAQPEAAKRLSEILSAPRDYLAHEYFNADWTGFYHREVAAVLAPLGLRYGCSATFAENLEQLNFSQSALALLAEVQDPAARETLKDYVLNRAFRTDLFIRGGTPLSADEALRQLGATRFALVLAPHNFPGMSLQTPLGTVRPQVETYQVLMNALGAAPATMDQLAAMPDVQRAFPGIELFNALLILLAIGIAEPALSAQSENERSKRVRRLNGFNAAGLALGAPLPVLASPVTGGALGLTLMEQLFVAGQTTSQGAVSFAHTWLNAGGHAVTRDGKTLEREDVPAELQRRYEVFASDLLPVLRHLQIVDF